MLSRIFQLLLAACLVVSSVWAANDPFVGKWKVNPSKSKLNDEMKVEVAGANRYSLTFAPGQVDRVVAIGSDQPALNGTIRVADIDWIEGAGVYVNLHIAGKELLYRSTPNELGGHLDPMRFIRVHRSSIVNIDSILEVQPISHGEFELILKGGHHASAEPIAHNWKSALANPCDDANGPWSITGRRRAQARLRQVADAAPTSGATQPSPAAAEIATFCSRIRQVL
jgi:hypothetical protein